MNSIRLFLALCGLFTTDQLLSQSTAHNNILRGKVLYQSSGNKPAAGVRIAEPDATAAFSLNNGDYELKFQNKRNGEVLALEIGKDNAQGQKLELVNEKEVRAAKLPADAENMLEIIVCPAGQRDIAAQKYYRILRTTSDQALEKKKKEVEDLLAQKEKDYQKISELFAQLDQMQAALDSAKIREQAFNIASINLDRASQMVKDAVQKIEDENDVEGALKILNTEALDTAYQNASVLKKKADEAIRQVIEGYEFKAGLLEPQFKYGEVAECYERIVEIYEKEGYDKEQLASNLNNAAAYWGLNGDYQKELEIHLKALAIREKVLPADHPDIASSYSSLAVAYSNTGDYQKQLEFNLKALDIREKVLPADDLNLAISYSNLAYTYGNLREHQKQLQFNLKALSIREKVLSADHPDLAASYNNLAMTYGYLGEHEKELEIHLKALSIWEKVLPAEHPNLAISYNNLAYSYGYFGERQKQLEFHLKAMAIREKVLPADHPLLAVSYSNLAVTYGYLNDYQKQLEFNLKALVIKKKVLPANHPELAISYNNIGAAYRNTGEHEKGIEYGQKAIRIGEASNPKPSYLNRFYTNLGVTYIKVRQFPEAKATLEKSESLNSKDPSVYKSWTMYYALQKKKKQSVESLQKAVEFGFKDLKWLETEPDLKNIRREKGYKDLVEQLKKQ